MCRAIPSLGTLKDASARLCHHIQVNLQASLLQNQLSQGVTSLAERTCPAAGHTLHLLVRWATSEA